MSKIVLDLNYPQFNQMPRFELGTSSELMIQVTDNGQIVDLTDHVVTLVVLSPDLQVVSQVLSIDDAMSGLVRCEMDDQLLASVGRFSARLLLVDADSNKASTGYFGYIVVDEELNADDIPMDEHTMYLLTEIVAKLTELELLEASREIAESDRISNEATRIEDEELRQDNENARMRAESAREQRVQAVLTQANEIVKVLNTNVDSALVDLYHRAEEWFLVNDAEIAEFYRSISLQIDALLNDANERFREQLDNIARTLSNMINQYIAQAEAELDQYQVTTTRDLSNRLNSYIAEVDKEIDGYKDSLQQQFNEALAETNEMATEYLEKLSTDVHKEMDEYKDDLMNQVDKYTDNAEQIITNTKSQMESAVNTHIELTDEKVDAKLEDIQGQITEAIEGVQTQVTDYLNENQEIIDKMVNDGYSDVSEFLGQAYTDIENWEQETKAELDTSVEEYKDAVDEFKEYNEQAHIDEDKRKQDHAQREAQLKTYEGRLENLEANHGGDVYERLKALEEVNRMQEIHLRALTNQDTSGKLEHKIQGNNELLPYSGNGVAQFLSIEGNTAINVVDDHGEIHDATPAIEGNAGRVVEDITPVDTKINPVIEGHTLVNTVECETPRIVPYEIDEVTTSHLPLNQDGHIIPKAVGRTLVNHNAEHDASIKLNSTVISASGDVIEGLASDGSADVSVKLTGTTMVNLADPAQEVPMTKAYDSVTNTHHTELPVETDWYVRPVVHGHTLVNRAYGEREILAMPEFNVEMEGNTTTVTEGIDGGKIEVNNVTGRTLVNLASDPLVQGSLVAGVEYDFTTNTGIRLGTSAWSISPWKSMRRCNIKDGVFMCYQGHPDYIEDGSNGDVMVEIPKFYYKVVPLETEANSSGDGLQLVRGQWYVSGQSLDGFRVHPMFIRNGIEVSKMYVSAYEGSLYDTSELVFVLDDAQVANFTEDTLCSISGAKPISGLTQNLTIDNAELLATNKGNNYIPYDFTIASGLQLLMLVEYCTFDIQAKLGRGYVDNADGTGNESTLTGATSSLMNRNGYLGTNGKSSISYHGIENPYGNIWKWVSGLNIEAKGIHKAYWSNDDYTKNTATNHTPISFTLCKTNGYITRIGYDPDNDFVFLPTSTSGTSLGDYFYQNNTYNGWLVALLGALWDDGSFAGGFSWSLSYSSGIRNRAVGARFAFFTLS